MIKELEEYRAILRKYSNPKADWSDDSLILDMHRNIRKNNEDLDSYSPEFAQRVREVETRPDKSMEGVFGATIGEGYRGLATDVKQTVASGKGAIGLLTGDESYLEGAEETLSERTYLGAKEPTVQDYDMIHDFESGTRYVSQGIGQMGTDIVTMLASLGAGTIVKKGIQKNVTKKVHDRLYENAIRSGASATQASTIAAQKLTKDAYLDVIRKAGNRGAVWSTGIIAAGESGVINTGEVYQNLFQYTKLPKDDPSYLSVADARWLSLGTGAVMGIVAVSYTHLRAYET